MEICWFCELLSYWKINPFFPYASCCCCWSFGCVWVNLWLRKMTLCFNWVSVQGVESSFPPFYGCCMIWAFSSQLCQELGSRGGQWTGQRQSLCYPPAKSFLCVGLDLICGFSFKNHGNRKQKTKELSCSCVVLGEMCRGVGLEMDISILLGNSVQF